MEEKELVEKCRKEAKKYGLYLQMECVIGELYLRIEALEAEVKLLKEEVYL